MQYFIYHPSGTHKIVTDEEYALMLKTGNWFKTPTEAANQHKENIDALVKKVKAKKTR